VAGPPKLDAESETIISRLTGQFASARQMQGKIRITQKASVDNQEQVLKDVTLDFAAEAPKRFRLVEEATGMGRVCDGKTCVRLLGPYGYAVEDVPPSIPDGVNIGPIKNVGPVIAMTTPGTLSRSELLGADVSVIFIGRRPAGERIVDVLNIASANDSWELFLSSDEPPVPVKISVDISMTLDEQLQMRNATASSEFIFVDWKYNQPTNADAFTYTPKEGERRFGSMAEFRKAMESGELANVVPLAAPVSPAAPLDPGAPGPMSAAETNAVAGSRGEVTGHPLVNQPAPTFQSKRLDGTAIALDAHQGKDVVLLDFWATTCALCVQAMPKLQSIATDYKDKGLVVYSVNSSGEDKETIEAFLAERSIDLPVLLDEEGDIAIEYQIISMPTTILIDRSGTIRFVHTSISEDFDQQLRQELDQLTVTER
jgi:peroxiredoxin